MRLLIIILLALTASIGLGTALSRDTGLLIFSYAGYNIQTSLSFFILASIVLFFGVYYLVRILFGLIRLPKKFDRWAGHRRHRRSEKYLTQGLLAMLEGNWKKAETSFKQGAKYSRLPVVNYLAAARAAQQSGAVQRRDHYLHLAHDDSSESSLALGLTQAKLQLSQKQTEQAYATLKHLKSENKSEEQVSALLLEATSDLNEWSEALDLLNDPACRKLLTAEQIKDRQLDVYAGLLQQSGSENDKSQLEFLWENMPAKLREEVSLIAVYVRARLQYEDTASCEIILRKILKKKWSAQLVELYGQVKGENPAKQLQFAEQLLKSHKGDAELLFTLGCLCKRGNLWGKARAYLEDSLDASPSPKACQELALLLEQQGEHATASVYFQRGLALATGRKDPEVVPLLERPDDGEQIADGARQVV